MNLKGRLEKMEAKHLGNRRTINVWLNPGESKEQALARRHAQYPDTPIPPDADILFITWHAPDSGPAALEADR
jgi:hypothetical protein